MLQLIQCVTVAPCCLNLLQDLLHAGLFGGRGCSLVPVVDLLVLQSLSDEGLTGCLLLVAVLAQLGIRPAEQQAAEKGSSNKGVVQLFALSSLLTVADAPSRTSNCVPKQ